MLTTFDIGKRKVASHLEKLVVPYEKHFKQAKTWDALRGACVQICGTAKSDQAVLVSHELLQEKTTDILEALERPLYCRSSNPPSIRLTKRKNIPSPWDLRLLQMKRLLSLKWL